MVGDETAGARAEDASSPGAPPSESGSAVTSADGTASESAVATALDAGAPMASTSTSGSVEGRTVEPFVLPVDSLQAVAESAGLQWVNSDEEKIRAVQAAMAAEPAPVHVPRERKPMVVVDEGPLVLVETRKDLSQVRLPFDR